MKSSNAVAAIYVILIFLSGVFVGGFGYRLYTASSVNAARPKSAEEYRAKYLAEMRSRLKLSDRQVEELNVILDATRERWRVMRERSKPEMKSIQDEQVERIRAILTPEQQNEYEKMRLEREKKSKSKPPGC
jgi:hypothetical protein